MFYLTSCQFYDQTKLWVKALPASLVNYETNFIGLDFYTETAKSVKAKEKKNQSIRNGNQE